MHGGGPGALRRLVLDDVGDLGPDWGFWQLFWPQAVRGVAVLFTMVPVVGMALKDMPDDELRDASGFNNLLRNLGGAVGIAVVNTWLIDFHASHARGVRPRRSAAAARRATAAGRPGAARSRLEGVDPAGPARAAAHDPGERGLRQSLTLAFDDVFRISAWLFLACLVVVPFCRGGPMTAAPPPSRALAARTAPLTRPGRSRHHRALYAACAAMAWAGSRVAGAVRSHGFRGDLAHVSRI